VSLILLRWVFFASALSPKDYASWAQETFTAIRKALGGEALPNPYFIDFPKGVPKNTEKFWWELIMGAEHPRDAAINFVLTGNLLGIPGYGELRHTYEEMVARHKAHIGDGRKLSVLEPTSYEEMVYHLVREVGESTVPVSADMRDVYRQLLREVDLETVAVPRTKEALALFNEEAVRRGFAHVLNVPTATDVLRLAVAMSGGDVSLQEKPRFRFSRQERRALLFALNKANINTDDIGRRLGEFKALFHALHPFEARMKPLVTERVGEIIQRAMSGNLPMSRQGRINMAMAVNDVATALPLFTAGEMWRSADWLLRTVDEKAAKALLVAFAESAPQVAGSVLLATLQQLLNRHADSAPRRFVTKSGRFHTETVDPRKPIKQKLVGKLALIVENEMRRRLAGVNLVVADELANVALPMSNRQTEEGFVSLPRGSRFAIPMGKQDDLRLFLSWVQKPSTRDADLDLSVAVLDEEFRTVALVNYNSLRGDGLRHSGDRTSARPPDGAFEAVDVDFREFSNGVFYVMPIVQSYQGDVFDDLADVRFGFMRRNPKDGGQPFEPSTVETSYRLTATGRNVFPSVVKFEKGKAEFCFINLSGRGRVAGTIHDAMEHLMELAKKEAQTTYLTVGWLASLTNPNAEAVSFGLGGDVTYTPATISELFSATPSPRG
jgi:stress response protein SCP2